MKNQLKVMMLTTKYALMRQMINKASFITNIIFMILNDTCFIVQWVILYSLKEDVGGYSFNQILLLWGIAASTYGVANFFFRKALSLSDTIVTGKLDSYLVQPKNVLLSVITADVEVSAIGDLIYGYIMLFVSGITIEKFLLFNLFSICGGIIIVCVAVLLGSLSFWIGNSDMIADMGNSLATNFATYPDGIFKGAVRILILTLIPVGVTSYIPIWVMTKFDLGLTMLVIGVTIALTTLAFFVFNRGLRRYSSSNLMGAKF